MEKWQFVALVLEERYNLLETILNDSTVVLHICILKIYA